MAGFSALPVKAAFKELGSSSAGLAAGEAEARLARFGRNVLDKARKKSLLSLFVDQFRNVLMLLLMGAAALSLVLGVIELLIYQAMLFFQNQKDLQ